MSLTLLRSQLTEDDVRRLVKADDIKARTIAAHKVCLRISEAGFSVEERAAANEILRLIAADAAIAVRKALSTTLKSSPHLPVDVAIRLANDIDEIATPVLAETPVLDDEDLIAIVRAGSAAKQIAIAGRDGLPSTIGAVIAEQGVEHAVAALLRNDEADVTEDIFDTALTRFSRSELVTDAAIDRRELPPTIAERLVSLISDEALQRLAQRHALPPQLAVELAEGARERATIDLLDQAGCATDMRRFVQQLQLNGRLTPSLVVRGLCLGHIAFFEHAMAELAGVPHSKAWVLVHDAGPLGLRAVFERTGIPGRLYAPVRMALDVYHKLELDGGPGDRARFTQTMIERLLSRSSGLAREEIDYLLEKLDAACVRAAEEKADASETDDDSGYAEIAKA